MKQCCDDEKWLIVTPKHCALCLVNSIARSMQVVRVIMRVPTMEGLSPRLAKPRESCGMLGVRLETQCIPMRSGRLRHVRYCVA